MDNVEHEMARQCYGYGRWSAPYWFIGLEEGQDPIGKDLTLRLQAMRDLGKDGLSDCRTFHQ
jgi:hypothetical protein